MTKEKFLLICEFCKSINQRQDQIAKVLECSFDGFNNSVELTYNFLFNLLKEEGIDESLVNCILDSIYEIIYSMPCYIIDTEANVKTKCESFEELYNLIF